MQLWINRRGGATLSINVKLSILTSIFTMYLFSILVFSYLVSKDVFSNSGNFPSSKAFISIILILFSVIGLIAFIKNRRWTINVFIAKLLFAAFVIASARNNQVDSFIWVDYYFITLTVGVICLLIYSYRFFPTDKLWEEGEFFNEG